MIEPGRFRHEFQLQSPASVNAGGEVTTTYTTQDTRRGALEYLSGKEVNEADQVEARATAKITLRYYTGLDETWRLRWIQTVSGVVTVLGTFGIQFVEDVRGLNRLHVCLCAEVDSGSHP